MGNVTSSEPKFLLDRPTSWHVGCKRYGHVILTEIFLLEDNLSGQYFPQYITVGVKRYIIRRIQMYMYIVHVDTYVHVSTIQFFIASMNHTIVVKDLESHSQKNKSINYYQKIIINYDHYNQSCQIQ